MDKGNVIVFNIGVGVKNAILNGKTIAKVEAIYYIENDTKIAGTVVFSGLDKQLDDGFDIVIEHNNETTILKEVELLREGCGNPPIQDRAYTLIAKEVIKQNK